MGKEEETERERGRKGWKEREGWGEGGMRGGPALELEGSRLEATSAQPQVKSSSAKASCWKRARVPDEIHPPHLLLLSRSPQSLGA